METKKYEAAFQLLASSITQITMENTMICVSEMLDMDRKYSINLKKLSIEDHSEYKTAGIDVEVNAVLSEKDVDNPKIFKISIVICGVFQADKNTSKEEFESKLRINGVAALYSISRGFITSLSSQALVDGKVMLPLVNFIEYSKDNNP